MGDTDYTCDFVANLSCSSSSFDEGEPLDYGQVHESEDSAHYEVRPYQFQPERDECQGPELAEENSVHDQAEQRLGSTFWCSCGNCSIKETVEECRCCKEISVIFEKTKELNVDCIINHPGFLTVCLDEYVLEAAYYAYRQQYGNREEILSDRNRYTAYRQLVRWCWGYLGREIRVALPSCAVDAIKQKFPSEGVVAASAPRKSLGGGGGSGASSSSSSGASPSGKNKYAGCNPVCMRPTPEWQKGIGGFLAKSQAEGKENSQPDAGEGTSGTINTIDEAGPSSSSI